MGILRNLFSDPMSMLLQMAYSLPAILIALSFHECAHAFAAYKLGDPTARNLGRMTVNPLHHIDPIGFVCLLLFGFGWAKPVPINPRYFKNYRRDDIIVSLAGITANFLLALVGMAAIYVFAVAGGTSYVLANMLYYFLSINLSLMIFNLIPIPPLDGSHVLESLLIKVTGPKPFLFLKQYGYYILLALMVLGVTSSIISAAVMWILGGLQQMFDAIFSFPGLSYIFYVISGMI